MEHQGLNPLLFRPLPLCPSNAPQSVRAHTHRILFCAKRLECMTAPYRHGSHRSAIISGLEFNPRRLMVHTRLQIHTKHMRSATFHYRCRGQLIWHTSGLAS